MSLLFEVFYVWFIHKSDALKGYKESLSLIEVIYNGIQGLIVYYSCDSLYFDFIIWRDQLTVLIYIYAVVPVQIL